MNEYEEMFDEIIDNQRRVSLSEKKNETTVRTLNKIFRGK